MRVRSGAMPARKQRTVWFGTGLVTGGKLARHSSVASSHRNANAQPIGRLPGAGARPGSPTIRSSTLMSGAAAVRYRVYGCLGAAKISDVGPCSTIRPAYITATRSARLATTARSCVTYRAATRCSRVQLADRLEHVGLGAHVEPGRRLVEHDHRWSTRERHRQADALLLAAGELVRITTQELGRPRQQDLFHHLDHAVAARLVAAAEPVELHHLQQLAIDAQRRVECDRRVLRDVADELAPRLAQLGLAQLEHRRLADQHDTARDPHALASVSEHAQPDRRLARARLAHEPQHLAGSDRQIDLVDDVLTARGDLDPQPRDRERRVLGHASPPCARSMPAAARDSPSPIRPVPIVSRAIAITGRIVPHGWSPSSPPRC